MKLVGINDVTKAEQTLDAIIVTGKVVEDFLQEYCHSELSSLESLSVIINHSLPDIGLRLRPFLLRASYEAINCFFDEILPIAAGIELLQLSTLVIDDVLDDSILRNNKPSILGKWGMKYAISSGIVMSSLGFSLIANSLEENDRCIKKVSVLDLLLRAHTDIYIGQFMDLTFESDVNVTENQYISMISKTTASFIQAPLVAGAMLWNASGDVVSILEEIGINLGIAYQLRDDVIDIVGEPESTGKPKAGDIQTCKMRLPLIHAVKHLEKEKNVRLLRILQTNSLLEESEVDEVIDMLKSTGSVEYVTNKAKEFCHRALSFTEKLSSKFEKLADHLHVIAQLISSFNHMANPELGSKADN